MNSLDKHNNTIDVLDEFETRFTVLAGYMYLLDQVVPASHSDQVIFSAISAAFKDVERLLPDYRTMYSKRGAA